MTFIEKNDIKCQNIILSFKSLILVTMDSLGFLENDMTDFVRLKPLNDIFLCHL